MSTTQTSLERVSTDESDDDCDCADLPAGFPCAECFIAGREQFGEVA